jgi:hypothetical protein
LLFSRFLSFFFSLLKDRCIPDNDDATSDEFDTQFPSYFEDELTSEQERKKKKKEEEQE